MHHKRPHDIGNKDHNATYRFRKKKQVSLRSVGVSLWQTEIKPNQHRGEENDGDSTKQVLLF